MFQDKFDSIFKKYPSGQRENLIFILQEIQTIEGYISVEAVEKISSFLSVPTVKIYSVATFYDQFRFKPGGKYAVKVCQGTSCHINNSNILIDEIKLQLSLINGNKEEESLFYIQTIPCMGACDKGPVFAIEDEYYTAANPSMIKPALEKFLEKHRL